MERAHASKEGRVIIEARDVALGAHAGREILAQDREGQSFRTRLFAAGGRVYVVAAGAKTPEALGDADTERFFESFQITAP